MSSENGFMGKAFGLFMDMDALIGADFERGLAELKKQVEAEAQAKADARARANAELEAAAKAAAEAAAAPPAE
jgi:hypothetical protein